MSNKSRHTPPAVKAMPHHSPRTIRMIPRPVTISHWSPRPHHDDPTVKTHDFAYITGIAPPTPTEKLIASIKAIITGVLAEPFLLRSLFLIFGGCCSNVYTLESILTLSSSTGTLITLLQFLAITLYTLPSQLTFTVTSPPEPPPLQPTRTVWFPRIKKRKVPLQQWCIFAAQFVVINILNNAAFGYKISLPLHIILRSAGPVASMGVGYVWKGNSYSRRKVLSVGFLFMGVVLAALSDAMEKPTVPSGATKNQQSTGSVNVTTSDEAASQIGSSTLSQQLPGFVLLLLALLLSSIMGIWTDTIYTKYGRSPAITSEQLFYGHLLSLPLFAIRYTTLQHQLNTLIAAAAAASSTSSTLSSQLDNTTSTTNILNQLNNPTLIPAWRRLLTNLLHSIPFTLPPPLLILLLNSTTQIACISGVQTLSTQTSALTVSIILNIRKVVSLLLSIWLFGNNLPSGVLVGAAIVFVGGGIYGMPDGEGEGEGKRRVMDGVVERERRRVNGDRESKKDR